MSVYVGRGVTVVGEEVSSLITEKKTFICRRDALSYNNTDHSQKLKHDRDWFFIDPACAGNEKPDDLLAVIYIPKFLPGLIAYHEYRENKKD